MSPTEARGLHFDPRRRAWPRKSLTGRWRYGRGALHAIGGLRGGAGRISPP